MKCQSCYWYNPDAEGSGCIQGHDAPPQGCPDFCEDWELLAAVSPADPRLGTAVGVVGGAVEVRFEVAGAAEEQGEWRRAKPRMEYEVGDESES